MTGPGSFSISPAEASAPTPVRLVMPSTGYTAQAFATNPCGAPIPGVTVTVAGNVATPHVPAGYAGVVFVDWKVSPDHQAASGGRVDLVLASRQTIGGKVTTCTTGRSPYGTGHHVASAPASHNGGISPLLDGLLGVVIILAAAVAVLALRLRGARGRGHRHAR